MPIDLGTPDRDTETNASDTLEMAIRLGRPAMILKAYLDIMRYLCSKLQLEKAFTIGTPSLHVCLMLCTSTFVVKFRDGIQI